MSGKWDLGGLRGAGGTGKCPRHLSSVVGASRRCWVLSPSYVHSVRPQKGCLLASPPSVFMD